MKILDQAFSAQGNAATAGGCFSSQYLAACMITQSEGIEAAKSAIHYVAPVGEKEETIRRIIKTIGPFV